MKDIIKCGCGHFEFEQVAVTQLGKTSCRDCARKVNRRLTKMLINIQKQIKSFGI